MRHETPLALIFIDIDHFKSINDTHGHSAGDFVLSELSAMLTTMLRTEDVLARFGGEEFTILCRGTDLAGVKVVAERLRVGDRAPRVRVRRHAHPGHDQRRRHGDPRLDDQGRGGVPGRRRQGDVRGEALGTQPRLRAYARRDDADAAAAPRPR